MERDKEQTVTEEEQDVLGVIGASRKVSDAEIFASLLKTRPEQGKEVLMPSDVVKITSDLRRRTLIQIVREPDPDFPNITFYRLPPTNGKKSRVGKLKDILSLQKIRPTTSYS